MPLSGAGIGHGLQHLVFGGVGLGEFERGVANLLVALTKWTGSELLRVAGVHSALRNHRILTQAGHRVTAVPTWMRGWAILLHFFVRKLDERCRSVVSGNPEFGISYPRSPRQGGPSQGWLVTAETRSGPLLVISRQAVSDTECRVVEQARYERAERDDALP